jgi:hypothetical protein
VINRTDLVERAEIIREKGTNRERFMLGLVDKYTWTDVSSSYAERTGCGLPARTARRRRGDHGA